MESSGFDGQWSKRYPTYTNTVRGNFLCEHKRDADY